MFVWWYSNATSHLNYCMHLNFLCIDIFYLCKLFQPTLSPEKLHFLWNVFGNRQDFYSLYSFLKMISWCSCLTVCAVNCLSPSRQPAAGSSTSVGMMASSDTEKISVCVHLQVCMSRPIYAYVNPPSHSLWQMCVHLHTIKIATFNFTLG